MEKLSRITGNLQSTLEGLSHYVENNTNVAGNISLDISEACMLRSYIESLQKDIDTLKSEVIELEKVENYNKAAENYKDPENREVKGKSPEPPKKPIGNMVNHPLHYQSTTADGKSLECIDVMEAVKGWFKTAIFCELNAFKYNWRLGNKDYIPTELGKIKWYSDKAQELWRNNLSWFYPKNQHIYAIIEGVKTKNPTTKEWFDAILYTDGSSLYVRDRKDFITKFKKA